MLNKLAAAAVVLGAAFFWNNFFPGTNQQELYETVEGMHVRWLSLFRCVCLLFRHFIHLLPSSSPSPDIPSSFFKEHKTLYGIVVKVSDGDTYKIRHVPGGPNAKVRNEYLNLLIPY